MHCSCLVKITVFETTYNRMKTCILSFHTVFVHIYKKIRMKTKKTFGDNTGTKKHYVLAFR